MSRLGSNNVVLDAEQARIDECTRGVEVTWWSAETTLRNAEATWGCAGFAVLEEIHWGSEVIFEVAVLEETNWGSEVQFEFAAVEESGRGTGWSDDRTAVDVGVLYELSQSVQHVSVTIHEG